jgi:hypothetical protein
MTPSSLVKRRKISAMRLTTTAAMMRRSTCSRGEAEKFGIFGAAK